MTFTDRSRKGEETEVGRDCGGVFRATGGGHWTVATCKEGDWEQRWRGYWDSWRGISMAAQARHTGTSQNGRGRVRQFRQFRLLQHEAGN